MMAKDPNDPKCTWGKILDIKLNIFFSFRVLATFSNLDVYIEPEVSLTLPTEIEVRMMDILQKKTKNSHYHNYRSRANDQRF